MDRFPPPLARGVEGLADGAGHVVGIAGPQFSGKSRLLNAVRAELVRREIRIVDLRGNYGSREIAYAALSPVAANRTDASRSAEASPTAAPASTSPLLPGLTIPGGLPIPPSGGSSRRRGRGDRGGPTQSPGGGAARPVARPVDGVELTRWLRGTAESTAVPVALLLEDAAFIDTESRESILAVARQARYRPILVVAALDYTVPAFSGWEDGLSGVGGVEWVRFTHAEPDPRDEARLRASFAALPEITQRILVLTALQGGAMSEVRLARASRLGVRELVDALAPALASDFVRVVDQQVRIHHSAWLDLLPTFVAGDVRRAIHREIADALSALLAEPDLRRGTELARHLFEASHDATALHHLRETAEIAERLRGFDAAEELLERAEECLPSLGTTERGEEEGELRFRRARALLYGGRLVEAEEEVRRALKAAQRSRRPGPMLDGGVEALFPALRAIGPRPKTMALLEHAATICGRMEGHEGQVGLLCLLARDEVDRAELGRARALAAQAARVATEKALAPQFVQSAAALLGAFAVAGGGGLEEAPTESGPVETGALTRGGTHPLRQLADEVQLRFLRRGRQLPELLEAHRRAAPILQRMGALSSELIELLDLAELTFDGGSGPAARPSIERARALCDLLHLLPPSPALARTTIAEGRLEAWEGRLAEARDRWSALDEQPSNAYLPMLRAEALLRRALLELAEGNDTAAFAILSPLSSEGLLERLPAGWVTTVVELASAAPDSRHGAAALPQRAAT